VESDPGTEGPASPLLATAALNPAELLNELRSRAQASNRAQERLTALLDAVMAVTADLQLSDVLTRIVRAACELVDANTRELAPVAPHRRTHRGADDHLAADHASTLA